VLVDLEVREPCGRVGGRGCKRLGVGDLRLRVQDADLERKEISVRHGKGGNDCRTVPPEALLPGLGWLEGALQ
jgi:hypothetical protein